VNLGHGYIPRIDGRNFKAVERCLPRDGPGLFHEGLDLPWAVLEAPWALIQGTATREFCRDRGVATIVDTQAWRYRDSRTFAVEKFAAAPYAPSSPISECSDKELASFVEECLKTQASLGAAAYLLPGVIPTGPRDDVSRLSLELLEASQRLLPNDARPCFAFLGVHTASIAAAHRLINELPHWLEGVYVQFTPINPLSDSPAKLIDCLLLLRQLVQRGFTVLGGRLANVGYLARALGVGATDSGLGEGESFDYRTKVSSYQPRAADAKPPRPVTGRLFVPQIGRSVSVSEWARLMSVPALRGQLVCRLRCCAFGQPVESTPQRGREHSLHARVDEAKRLQPVSGAASIEAVGLLLEQRQSTARMVSHSLAAAGLDPLGTEFIENQIAVVRFLRGAISDVA